MGPQKAIALAACAAGMAAACSLFTDLSGFSDGPPDEAGAAGDGALDANKDAASSDGRDGAADAGTATCPPYVLPPSCDSEYLSDSKNCCIAGRDCQGGACLRGACQPVVIVPNATADARGIAVSNDIVVWATGCTHIVRRVRNDGTGNVALPSGLNCAPTLAVSGSNVYWIEFNGPFLNTTKIDGTTALDVVAEMPTGAASSSFGRLAVDATRAYWASESPPSVWFALLTSSHVTASALAGPLDSGVAKEIAQRPYGVAVDATHVYWSDLGTGGIERRVLTGLGTDILAEQVANDSSQPGDLALDAERVYWVSRGGYVRSHLKNGMGDITTLASGETNVETILVDDQYVYWARHELDSSVKRVPKAGGQVQVLAMAQKAPWELAQDCTTIYWTNHNNFGTGEVVKLTK